MSEWQLDEKAIQTLKTYGMTGQVFVRDGSKVIITTEDGLLHLSISREDRLPTYDELKEARYALLPDEVHMAMIFPPKEEFVNVHSNCLHLFQLAQGEIR